MTDHEHPGDLSEAEKAAQSDDSGAHDIMPADGGYNLTAWDPVEMLRQALVAGDLERARTLIGPVWHEREGLRRLVAAYEHPPLSTSSGGPVRVSYADCCCPPGHVCSNSACPRAPKVTC